MTDKFVDRYKRNHNAISKADQIKLAGSRVAVVGCGGLGGYLAEEFARLGVGRLLLIDGDRFEESNLNRQLFATESTLGQWKVEACRERLKTVNSEVEVDIVRDWFREEEAAALFNGEDEYVPLMQTSGNINFSRSQSKPAGNSSTRASDLQSSAGTLSSDSVGFGNSVHRTLSYRAARIDLVCDALDNIPACLALERACHALDIPLIFAAIGGWYGQLGFSFPGDFSIARLFGKSERGVESILGNPAFTPAVIASLAVAEGLKYLTGKAVSLRRSWLMVDLLNMEFDQFEILAEGPPGAQRQPLRLGDPGRSVSDRYPKPS